MPSAYSPTEEFSTRNLSWKQEITWLLHSWRMIKLLLLAFLLLPIQNAQPPAPEIWAEPIPYLETAIVEDYLAPVSKYGAGHRGIDFKVPLGSEIHAPSDGVIHFRGKVVNRQLVTVRTDSGKRVSFEPVCSHLAPGDRVSKGEVIGYQCNSDPSYKEHCEGCIHASVRDEYGYLSPMQMFGQLSPSVLLS